MILKLINVPAEDLDRFIDRYAQPEVMKRCSSVSSYKQSVLTSVL